MQIIGNLFYVVLFISIVGSLFVLAHLFMQKVLRLPGSLWAHFSSSLFFLIPLVMPQAHLFSPEGQSWIAEYRIASIVWLLGTIVFLLFYVLRQFMAYRTVRRCTPCDDAKVTQILSECAEKLGLKHLPRLLFGDFDEIACVITLLRPTVLLNKTSIEKLSEKELRKVILHELLHVKRRHHLLQRVFDIASIMHWFNPLVWIARHDFSIICETDCDSQIISTSSLEISPMEYTNTMIRLLEMITQQKRVLSSQMGAQDFLVVKHRFLRILHKPSKLLLMVSSVFVAACVAGVILFSLSASQSYFYPHSSSGTMPEYSYIHLDEQ